LLTNPAFRRSESVLSKENYRLETLHESITMATCTNTTQKPIGSFLDNLPSSAPPSDQDPAAISLQSVALDQNPASSPGQVNSPSSTAGTSAGNISAAANQTTSTVTPAKTLSVDEEGAYNMMIKALSNYQHEHFKQMAKVQLEFTKRLAEHKQETTEQYAEYMKLTSEQIGNMNMYASSGVEQTGCDIKTSVMKEVTAQLARKADSDTLENFASKDAMELLQKNLEAYVDKKIEGVETKISEMVDKKIKAINVDDIKAINVDDIKKEVGKLKDTTKALWTKTGKITVFMKAVGCAAADYNKINKRSRPSLPLNDSNKKHKTGENSDDDATVLELDNGEVSTTAP